MKIHTTNRSYTLHYRDARAEMYYDASDCIYVGRVVGDSVAVFHGDTQEKARQAFCELVDHMLAIKKLNS